MESLPRDIILDILSRLPISSLVQFSYVCRAWRKLAQDHNLVDLPNSHKAAHNNNSLCLIFHCDYPIRNHLYFLDFPSEYHSSENVTVKRIHTPFCSSMPEFVMIGSCNGLLCLSDFLYNNSLYIYNPFTRDHIELPKSIQYPNQEVVYGFGFHSQTKEYKVLKIIYYRKGNRGQPVRHRYTVPPSDVQILTLGSSTWRSLGKVYHYLVQCSEQVLVNGRLHWLTLPRRYYRGRGLVSFDLADEKFREVQKPVDDGLRRSYYHLVVLRGCLAAVFFCSHGKLEIWIMKEYGVEESWVKEFNMPSQIPKAPKIEVNQSFRISNLAGNGKFRVLCLLRNSEILLEYKSRVLVVYDPKIGKFKELMFQGLPKWFQSVVHVGNLNRIDSIIGL